MRTKLSIATAIAGSMVVTGLLWGAAQATPAPLLNSDANSGIVLVGHGGGHGGGPGGGLGRGGGPGGGWGHGGGPGGGWGHGGGPGGLALRGGPGHMSPMNRGGEHYAFKSGGPKYGGNYGHVNRGGDHYAFKGHDHDNFDHGKHRQAFNDRNHDHHGDFHRHRVFRNGVWVWVYGPDYTAYGNDCYWLRRQAIITGSPYWWDRYNACVGYDYY
jgi:hypothetical protein